MAIPTAEWEKVGDKFYRKIQLYTAVFDQDLELENYVVTGCSYGGAIDHDGVRLITNDLIRPNLVEAVDTCVKAAGHEFSIHWQKQLLRAASFGKSVLDIYNSDDFVDMCETLRVLNAVRYYEIGLPLSYEQFLRLTPEKLIQRLIS
ncbi:vacuolar protein-like protein sorting vps16, partial [Diplocarpon rosae]